MPMIPSVRRLVGCVTVSLLFLSITTVASAAVYKGSASDGAGDGPTPGLDIRKAQATYDSSAGSIRFTIDPAGPLDGTPVQIATGVGTLNSGICSTPLAVVGSIQPGGSVVWGLNSDGDSDIEASGTASITISGSRVSFAADDPDLAGLSPNCGEAVLSDANDINTTFDTTSAFGVRVPPKKARLATSISGPSKMKPGSRARFKVKVRNRGDRPARKVTLRLSGKGGSVKGGARKLGTIKGGKGKTATFTVKAGRKGSVKLTAKATGAGVKASARKTVRIARPGKPRPPAGRSSLTGQLFWGFEAYQFDRSSDILGLYFANSRFVHWGIPKGGLKNCSRVTAKLDEDGELQPGCLRYSFNERSGKLSIGKAKGSYRNGELKLKMDEDMWRIDGSTWFNSAFAKPGSRLNVTLQNRGYYGACGISPSCTTWLELLTLDRNGKFGRTRSSLSTGGGGSLPFIAIGSYPPEDRGSYRILSNGRIRFSYDNGEVSTETLVIQTNKRGKPDAAKEGVLLDDVWFYKDSDD